jgi:hypothetical protein
MRRTLKVGLSIGCAAVVIAILSTILLKRSLHPPTTDITWVDEKVLNGAEKFEDVFTQTDSVVLKGAVLGEVKKVLFLTDGSLYTCERNSVKQFDWRGTFVREVAGGGAGPGKIQRLFDACILKTNELCVLDRALTCQLYDSSGQFSETIQLTEKYDQIAADGNYLYLYCPARMHQAYMGCGIDLSTRQKTFDYAPPTQYLASFREATIRSRLPRASQGAFKSTMGGCMLSTPWRIECGYLIVLAKRDLNFPVGPMALSIRTPRKRWCSRERSPISSPRGSRDSAYGRA